MFQSQEGVNVKEYTSGNKAMYMGGAITSDPTANILQSLNNEVLLWRR